MITTDLLKEKLDSIKPDIDLIIQYWNKSTNEQEFQDLEKQTNDENFWQHPEQAKISQRLQAIRTIREEYQEITGSFKELNELVSMFSDGDQELDQINNDTDTIIRKTKQFKITLLLGEEYDSSNCFLELNSGAGGTGVTRLG